MNHHSSSRLSPGDAVPDSHLDTMIREEAMLTELYDILAPDEKTNPVTDEDFAHNRRVVNLRVQLAEHRSYIAQNTPRKRDFEKEPLTDLEKAYLSIAMFDAQYHRLRSAAEAVVESRFPLSKAQSAVLTSKLDALDDVIAEEKPKWPEQSPKTP